VRHIDTHTKKQTRKQFIPLALAALIGGGGPLWAQTASTLDTVVVTASRAQERVREVSSNVTIIDAEDIKASTAANLADLAVQHGFQVLSTGGESNVQIRGMGTLTMSREQENQVLILLNGRRAGMSNLALAGLANVERVEIIRGPSAVQYGSSALGGVINVITRRGQADKAFASVEIGLGSDSLKRKKIAFGGAANGFDFAFGGTHFTRDDVTTHNGQRWYHTALNKSLTGNFDLGYSFGGNHRVGINHNEAEVDYEGTSGLRPWASNVPGRSYTEYVKRNKNTALSYSGSTDRKDFDWLLNYSWGKNEQVDTNPATQARSAGHYWDNEVFNAQLNHHADSFSLSGGIDRFQYKTSQYDRLDKTAMKDTGAYLTGKLRLLQERLVFTLGLRYDRYENTGNLIRSQKDSHTGGSFGASFMPVEWLKLRANYAEGFKMPSPRQSGGETPYYIANPSLRPETSTTWEFGADIDWNHASGSLTWFHSDWKDKIVGIPQSSSLPECRLPGMRPNSCYQNRNLKSATVAGVEGALRYDIGKAFGRSYSLSPYVNFTWLGTRRNGDTAQRFTYRGKQESTMERTPEWMASYGVDYAHPGLRLKTRVNASYYGSVFTNDATVKPSRYIKRPGATLVNWSLEKELSDFGGRYGRLTLRTEVNNLFDAKNEVYWNYPGPGRNFYVGLRHDF
jgi:vitamin B12 transporter